MAITQVSNARVFYKLEADTLPVVSNIIGDLIKNTDGQKEEFSYGENGWFTRGTTNSNAHVQEQSWVSQIFTVDRHAVFTQNIVSPVDNAVIWTSPSLLGYSVHTFNVTSGSISVQLDIAGDGIFTGDIAMHDLLSTTAGTLVLVSGVGTVQVEGNYAGIRVLADGVVDILSTSTHTNGEKHG